MPRSSPQLAVSINDHIDDHPRVAGLTDRQFRVLVTALICHGAGHPVVIPKRNQRGLMAAGLVNEDGELTEHATWFIGPVTRADRRRPIPADVRNRVFERDGWACLTCGTDQHLTLDHIQPWSRGGSDDENNLCTLCRSCNSRKGARV